MIIWLICKLHSIYRYCKLSYSYQCSLYWHSTSDLAKSQTVWLSVAAPLLHQIRKPSVPLAVRSGSRGIRIKSPMSRMLVMAANLSLNPIWVQLRSHKPQILVLVPGFHGDSSVFMEAPSEEADDRTQHVMCAADVMALIRKNLQQFKKRVRMCIQLQNGQHGKK